MEKSKQLNIFPIEITIVGKNITFEGELIRTNAPRTVERILAKLPTIGKASKRGSQLNLPIDIKMGKEKSSTKAQKGDIGYLPLGDTITIFLDDTEPYGEVNIIGRISSNLEALLNTRLLVTLKITQK